MSNDDMPKNNGLLYDLLIWVHFIIDESNLLTTYLSGIT